MLTLQPQHAFRRQSNSQHLSMPRRPRSRAGLGVVRQPSRSPSPANYGPSSYNSTAAAAAAAALTLTVQTTMQPPMMQPPSPPFFLSPLAPAPDLPPILLHPCLAPDKFVAVCRHPAILADLVDYTHSIHDFLSFIYVSKEMRAIVGAAFENDIGIVRHRFFARFLPGHSRSRPYWNPRLRIDLTDLELFRAYSFPSSPNTCRLIQPISSRIRGCTPFQLPDACPHVDCKPIPTFS